MDGLLNKMTKSNYCYVIQRMVEWKHFYLFDIDETEHVGTVVWTPNLKQALVFALEEEIEDIKASYKSLSRSIIMRVGKQEVGL